MSDDGGPAFPANTLDVPFDDATNPKYLGISARDYFAAKAMQAIVPVYAEANGGVGVDHLPRNCAIIAYRIADAMLAERAK